MSIFKEQESVISPKRQTNKIIFELLFYLGIFIIAFVLFFVLKPKNEIYRSGAVVQSVMILFIALAVTVAICYALKCSLDRKTAIFILFFIGVVIRIGYMLYTPLSTRQHDTFTSSQTGHEAYAWTIYTTGNLPDSNSYQFYHPPLNAFIQATFMRFVNAIVTSINSVFDTESYFLTQFLQGYESSRLPAGSEYRYFLYSTSQILAVVYSVITCVYMLKLINLFGFKNKTAVLTSAIVIFFPRCIQFSAMVNNDALSLMFSILALYFALKWQKQGKNPINILLCAFACGFGMMTKLATATICLPIAGVFVYEFILEIKQFILDKKNGEKVNFLQRFSIIFQYVGFLLVCAPLALWFQFYVSARFGQNFGFVFDNLNHRLSTEHHSLFERLFFTFDLNEYFGQIYCSPFYTENKLGVITNYNHYNLFNYQLRSALFGEFWYDGGEGFAVFALIASFAFCAVLAVAVVKCCSIYFKGRKNGKKALVNINFKDLIFIVLLFVSQIIPEIIFYIRMPYACTMDFRYVMPIIVGLAVTVGYVSNILKSEGSQFSIGLNNVLTYTIIVVLLAMTLFYCVCM